jgi:hypothetical protein
MLLKTELRTWLGKKYCDEAELLHLLLAHTVVRRWRTIIVAVQPLGGDSMEVWLDDEALQATLVRTTKTEVAHAHGIKRTAESERLEQEKQHAMAAADQRRSIRIENTPQKFEFVAGVYELSCKNSVSGRGVWQLIGGRYAADMRPTLFYCTDEQKWLLWWKGSNRALGWDCRMSVASTALTPDQITETWQVSDGTAWVDAPNMKVRVCDAAPAAAAPGSGTGSAPSMGSAPPIDPMMDPVPSAEQIKTQDTPSDANAAPAAAAAAAERLDDEKYNANAGNAETYILLEGQQQGDHQHDCMGMYELMEGKEVNGRGAWQMAGGKKYFMYYASGKTWWISGRASMEAGKASGWMSVDSTALTPDQVTETWRVDDGTPTGWVDAPKVRARMYSAEEKRASEEKLEQELEQERKQAMSAARQCTDILLEGQQQGDHQHYCMGMYELMEGNEMNGRGVWQMAGGVEWFVYYASTKKWLISHRAAMEAGKATGSMYVASTAPTPDQVTETWKVSDGTGGWVDAPKVRARMCSAEEKHGHYLAGVLPPPLPGLPPLPGELK